MFKVKKVLSNAKLPTRAHDTDACFDLYNAETEEVIIPPEGSAVFHTGIAVEIPAGYFAPVFSRSGMGFNQDLRLANCVGIIDAGYRGEWMVKLVNDSDKYQRVIEPGDRIAQFTILPLLYIELVEVDELTDTDRGEGGFGSTGK